MDVVNAIILEENMNTFKSGLFLMDKARNFDVQIETRWSGGLIIKITRFQH